MESGSTLRSEAHYEPVNVLKNGPGSAMDGSLNSESDSEFEPMDSTSNFDTVDSAGVSSTKFAVCLPINLKESCWF